MPEQVEEREEGWDSEVPELFMLVVRGLLGRELALSATPEGPVLDLDGIRLLIGEESLVVDGEDEVDFEVLGPMLPVVAALHRLFWFLRPLPMRSQREDGRSWQLSAREPFGAQLYVDGVLHLELAVYTFDAQGVIENVASVSGPFLELSTLGGEGGRPFWTIGTNVHVPFWRRRKMSRRCRIFSHLFLKSRWGRIRGMPHFWPLCS